MQSLAIKEEYPNETDGSLQSCIQNDDLDEKYLEVGRVLMVCEAADFRVGIPWLFPSNSVALRKEQFHSNIDEFLKTELVTVKTPILESYMEDLEVTPPQPESYATLGLWKPNLAERHALSIVSAILVILSATAFRILADIPLNQTIAVGLLASTFTAYSVSMLCSELNRRLNFSTLLSKEISRRTGGEATEQTRRIGLFSVEPKQTKPS